MGFHEIGIAQDLGGRAIGDDAAGVQQDGPLAEVENHLQVKTLVRGGEKFNAVTVDGRSLVPVPAPQGAESVPAASEIVPVATWQPAVPSSPHAI